MHLCFKSDGRQKHYKQKCIPIVFILTYTAYFTYAAYFFEWIPVTI